MIIADAIGIYIGVVAGRRIPEKAVKWISALIFISFGYIDLYYSVPARFVSPLYLAALLAATALAVYLAARWGGGKGEKK
jgi:small basic protein